MLDNSNSETNFIMPFEITCLILYKNHKYNLMNYEIVLKNYFLKIMLKLTSNSYILFILLEISMFYF